MISGDLEIVSLVSLRHKELERTIPGLQYVQNDIIVRSSGDIIRKRKQGNSTGHHKQSMLLSVTLLETYFANLLCVIVLVGYHEG